MNQRLHLICNAHIDPVWQWEWEEGAAAAMSTFRTAADLCEEFDGFVFCHNEALLYMWVSEYEPELFARIRTLVAEGKWHIMGGWFNQPDCNMPSGEAFVRQALFGRRYFQENFNARPKTVINFDPFGHTRGLVQILKKCGYENYMFCRPGEADLKLTNNAFLWKGYDGSEVIARRVESHYLSALGHAVDKVKEIREKMDNGSLDVCLWGVGNHGGGPSRKDINDIDEYIKASAAEGCDITHSTPDKYFDELKKRGGLPEHAGDLNPWAVGCYTSQIRIKQKYRKLENALFMAEKMASHAHMAGLLEYPASELNEAVKYMLVAQFHDTLPGSSIQPVEESGLRGMEHGLEILSRVTARTFFALASGHPKPESDEIPILVYNPHPYEIIQNIECEFMLWDIGWEEKFSFPHVYQNGREIPAQPEKEMSTIPLNWRKRVVFSGKLPPMQMSCFMCKMEMLPQKPPLARVIPGQELILGLNGIKIGINTCTGLVDSAVLGGVDYLLSGAFSLEVMADDFDPWGMRVSSFTDKIGQFELMTEEESRVYSSLKAAIPSVRIIEDGDVRTVAEAVFKYGGSSAVIHYKVPKFGNYIDINIRVNWTEKQKMLKLAIPSGIEAPEYLGEVAFGAESLPVNGRENISHRYIIMRNSTHGMAVLNDGIYGSSCEGGTLKLSLLRSPSYTAQPTEERAVMPQDRHMPYIDQGERLYAFRIVFGSSEDISQNAGRMGAVFNQKPMAVSFFPTGKGTLPDCGVELSDNCLEMTAMKLMENGDGYILRLFNPTSERRGTKITVSALKVSGDANLGAFEAATFKVSKNGVEACEMLEGLLIGGK